MKNKITKIKLFGLISITAIFLFACGSGERKIRNQPPQIFIAGIVVVGDELRFDLQIKNINNLAIPRAQIRFRMFFDGQPVFSDQQMIELSLDGRGTESASWQGRPHSQSLVQLAELSAGDIQNLDYQSRGEMENMETGKQLKFSKRGSVFAVPGKPGHYRVAGVSDASRLDRKKVTDQDNYH